MYYQLHALRWQDFEDLVAQLCHKPVETFHFDRPAPSSIRLHLVRDEVMAIA